MLAFFILFIFAIRPAKAQTPSVTLTPTATVSISPTQSPTPTPNISLVISEFMPDASPEWVEIRNLSSLAVSIVDWKLGDSSTVTKTIPSTTIPANGYYVFETSSYLNNSGDDVRLINNSGAVVDSTSYTSSSNIYSWSKNSSWCFTVQSKGSSNNSCANITPSPTPTLSPTQTPSPTTTPYPTSTTGPTQPPTSTPTRYPTFTPIPTVAPLPTDGPEPTVVIEPTATMSPDVLGDNTVNQDDIGDIVFPTPTPKSIAISNSFISPTILAAVFVGLGGVLLLIPIIVIKLRQ